MKRALRSTLLSLALTFCLAAGPGGAAADQVTWRDSMNREVTVTVPSARIVSLAPSATETLFALGAGDLLVGVSRHCDYPVEAKLKPKTGDFNSPDLEKVKEAAPDVVLFAEYARAEDLDALDRAGIPAFVLPAKSVEDVIASIRSLGELSGTKERAAGLAAGISGKVEEIAGKLRAGNVPPRSVYVEVDGPRRLYAVGPGSFMDDVVRLAGGRNVFAGREAPYFPVEGAEVIEADPDVILVDYPFQYKVGVSKREGWGAISAVKEERVYDGTDFDIILFNRPGPRIAEALEEISALLHPEVFRER